MWMPRCEPRISSEALSRVRVATPHPIDTPLRHPSLMMRLSCHPVSGIRPRGGPLPLSPTASTSRFSCVCHTPGSLGCETPREYGQSLIRRVNKQVVGCPLPLDSQVPTHR